MCVDFERVTCVSELIVSFISMNALGCYPMAGFLGVLWRVVWIVAS